MGAQSGVVVDDRNVCRTCVGVARWREWLGHVPEWGPTSGMSALKCLRGCLGWLRRRWRSGGNLCSSIVTGFLSK